MTLAPLFYVFAFIASLVCVHNQNYWMLSVAVALLGIGNLFETERIGWKHIFVWLGLSYWYQCPDCGKRYNKYYDGNDCTCGVRDICEDCYKAKHSAHDDAPFAGRDA